MKKFGLKLTMFFSFFVLAFCGLMLSSCCTPAPLEVKVTFIGADSRLELKDYSYFVEFNDTTKVSFKVPKGYDHNQIAGSIKGSSGDVVIDYTMVYDDDLTPIEGYEYDYDRTITYEINFIKRDFELKIDLSKMTKLTFDITLEKSMDNFKGLIIKEEDSKKLLTELREKDVLEVVQFDENNTAKIEYGKYLILCRSDSANVNKYNAIYSDINHYTLDKDKATLGTINYSVYNRAKKGNSNYLYNGDYTSRLYYFGEVKEDINFYPQIPNYVEDKGFQIDRNPNIFYLFTNMSKYNSDMLTMEAFTTTSSAYDKTNANMDKIEDKTIRKVEATGTFNDRYDIYKIYLGENLDIDPLISVNEKSEINEDLYFVISSNMDLSSFNFYLLSDQYEKPIKSNCLEISTSTTDKGKYYIHLSRDLLSKYVLDREEVANSIVYNYKTGLAIFHAEVDYSFFNREKMGNYMRIYKNIYINGNQYVTTDDLHIEIYRKDGNTIDYGITDNHYWSPSGEKIDCSYFKTSDIFQYNEKNKEYVYQKNLYLSIWGKEYENYKSPTITSVLIKMDGDSPTNDEALVPTNAEDYNGLDEFHLENLFYRNLGEYTWNVTFFITSNYSSSTLLDFSNLVLTDDYTQGLFMTSNSNFTSKNDFELVNEGNKNNSFNNLKFGMSGDLYYFDNVSNDFDIEIRLDPNDPSTVISTSIDFCDIKGDKITMEINGKPYKIKVIKQNIIYKLLDGKMYVVRAGS